MHNVLTALQLLGHPKDVGLNCSTHCYQDKLNSHDCNDSAMEL